MGERDSVVLGPTQEASRLWQGAEEELAGARTDFVRLCEALDLGIRAAQILAILKLESVREKFPATIGMLLERPPEEVDPWRDVVQVPKTLQFAEILDMLSADELECITPHLHRGWEDRRRSCGRARALAREATGVTVDAPTRERLMILAAYRNRIFHASPPVRIVPAEVIEAFPALRDLVTRLGIGGLESAPKS